VGEVLHPHSLSWIEVPDIYPFSGDKLPPIALLCEKSGFRAASSPRSRRADKPVYGLHPRSQGSRELNGYCDIITGTRSPPRSILR
jgi:hypothetical protein